ncbi:NAD(P)-dependent oxidoreductase [Candidatus Roizmanbacteria bacterium]|nr:NAD(P)-dependent oxidoreductase [Candidatus Roizmanbacteria bacterium]
MKILVTGGAGFLGLHIAKYIASLKKDSLTLLDIAPFNKKEYPKGCTFVTGDVRDKKLVNELLADHDAVIHAAAALPLWKAEEIMDTNVRGTKVMLDAAIANKIKRFIYISSTAVYGVPKKHPVYETDPMVGVGAYGHSKIQAEKACKQARKKGLVVTVIRPKTFVGTHRLGVFEILFDWIKDGKKIPVVGSGNNRYQLLEVDDLVHALYLCLLVRPKEKINDTFNIGAEKFTTVRQDLQQLFDYANSGSTLLSTPAWPIKKALFIFEKLHLSPLYQWVYDTADKDSFVSIDKIKKTLKWKPKNSNGQALIKSYQWYLENYVDVKSRPAGVTHTVGWKQGILGFFKRFM